MIGLTDKVVQDLSTSLFGLAFLPEFLTAPQPRSIAKALGIGRASVYRVMEAGH